MTEAELDIKQWGNSLGVRLPVAVARAAHLHLDQRVRSRFRSRGCRMSSSLMYAGV